MVLLFDNPISFSRDASQDGVMWPKAASVLGV